MKRRLTILVLLGSLAAIPASAQPSGTPYAQQVDWFFTLLRAGRTDEAVEGIYANNPTARGVSDQVAALKSALRDWPATLGDFLEYERLTQERLGTRFVRLDFVVSFDRRPVRMFFEFYRGKTGWTTQAVGLMDDIAEWSREKARADFSAPASAPR